MKMKKQRGKILNGNLSEPMGDEGELGEKGKYHWPFKQLF
jgi:hypothetical protein